MSFVPQKYKKFHKKNTPSVKCSKFDNFTEGYHFQVKAKYSQSPPVVLISA